MFKGEKGKMPLTMLDKLYFSPKRQRVHTMKKIYVSHKYLLGNHLNKKKKGNHYGY